MNERNKGEIDWSMLLMFLLIIFYIIIGSCVLAALLNSGGGHILEVRDGNHFRNFLEILFFASSSTVPVIAAWAALFAKRQIEEAEHTRIAGVYMQITDRWNSPRLIASRMYILALMDKYNDTAHIDKEKKAAKTVQEYIRMSLIDLRSRNRSRFVECIQILIFLEDLGLLCVKRYVNENDIFEFIGSAIAYQVGLLADYIKHESNDDSQAYKNALLVAARAEKFLAVADAQ